jgi:hypothetical protein
LVERELFGFGRRKGGREEGRKGGREEGRKGGREENEIIQSFARL